MLFSNNWPVKKGLWKPPSKSLDRNTSPLFATVALIAAVLLSHDADGSHPASLHMVVHLAPEGPVSHLGGSHVQHTQLVTGRTWLVGFLFMPRC
eukprot:gene320-33543_t